jgi:hypothetical protein
MDLPVKRTFDEVVIAGIDRYYGRVFQDLVTRGEVVLASSLLLDWAIFISSTSLYTAEQVSREDGS